MKRIDRRQFLDGSFRGAAAVSAGLWASSRVLGANERVRVALVGCGGRGQYVIRGMIEQGADAVCLCDLHEGRRAAAARFIEPVQQKAPRLESDMRRVFDADDIDAVVIATPDHWHAPASIAACRAGKDVYVEKPHCYDIRESRIMLDVARQTGRVLQVGTQNRSAPYNLAALDYVRSGKLGDVRLVKVYNLKPGGPFDLGDPGAPPPGFDWDAWLGPAPDRPYHQQIFTGGWHHFWDFSGGDLCDDGIHQLDLAIMLMGDPGLPRAVVATGGRLQHRGDDSEVPDLLVVAYDFDDFVLTLEHSDYPRYMRKTESTIRRNDEFPYWTQNATRVELYGSELHMTVGRHGGGWQVVQSGGRIVDQMFGRPADAPHYADFLDAVRTRRRPNADIQTLHPSGCMIHMANIAHRTGNRKLWFDADTETFPNDDDANDLLGRTYRRQYAIPQQA